MPAVPWCLNSLHSVCNAFTSLATQPQSFPSTSLSITLSPILKYLVFLQVLACVTSSLKLFLTLPSRRGLSLVPHYLLETSTMSLTLNYIRWKSLRTEVISLIIYVPVLSLVSGTKWPPKKCLWNNTVFFPCYIKSHLLVGGIHRKGCTEMSQDFYKAPVLGCNQRCQPKEMWN